MPLYEYECFVCSQRFERIQKVSADPISECPSCGGSVRRLLGSPALQFKGSGWYVTDYGKGNAGTPATQADSGSDSGSASSSSSSDSSSSSSSDSASSASTSSSTGAAAAD